jgi:acyl-CoA reductase-like NAD-dependent aldehyde dehydrogenase
MQSEGATKVAATKQVDTAIDAWVWYAGWADKYVQVAGNGNAVSGPYFNLSTPEPSGVVAIVAPQGSTGSLLGLVSVVAPAILTGNTVVVVANQTAPLSAISLSEVLATSDVPGGVVNILTGSPTEIAPWLAGHADVNALDLAGADELDWVGLQVTAADTLKRVLPPDASIPAPSLERIVALTETKTVWHTKSLI